MLHIAFNSMSASLDSEQIGRWSSLIFLFSFSDPQTMANLFPWGKGYTVPHWGLGVWMLHKFARRWERIHENCAHWYPCIRKSWIACSCFSIYLSFASLNAKDTSLHNYTPRAWRNYKPVLKALLPKRCPAVQEGSRARGITWRPQSTKWMSYSKLQGMFILYHWGPIQNAWGMPPIKLSGNYK